MATHRDLHTKNNKEGSQCLFAQSLVQQEGQSYRDFEAGEVRYSKIFIVDRARLLMCPGTLGGSQLEAGVCDWEQSGVNLGSFWLLLSRGGLENLSLLIDLLGETDLCIIKFQSSKMEKFKNNFRLFISQLGLRGNWTNKIEALNLYEGVLRTIKSRLDF